MLKELVRKTLHTIEMPFDAVKFRVKSKLHLFDSVGIVPYRSYGNSKRMQLLGRVMEVRDIGDADRDDPWWRNTLAMARRFTTDEIPNAEVRGTIYGKTVETTSDSEGYFQLVFEFDEPLSVDSLWHEVELELLTRITSSDQTTATGQILVPPDDAEFGVISDIDDTILQSSATDTWRLIWLTCSNNALTRTPFPHVAPFYQALQEGVRGAGPNPIFYVSSSAWNIYDLLEDFLRLHDIPEGPIMLRDLGLDSNKFIKTDHQHKLEKIEQILRYYPRLPFILIGDSGQRDPWLYREAVRRNPDRITAVYIRDVQSRKTEEIREIAAELKGEGVEMLLVEDACEAARHARAAGFIASDVLAEDRVEQSVET